MNQTRYESLYQPFRKEGRKKALVLLDRGITYSIVLAYASILLFLLVKKDTRILPVFVVPAIFLVVVSVVRAIINWKRPYEVFGTSPILPREKLGKSMPSRHVASASIISMVIVYLFGWWGAIAFLATLLLGMVRVVGGVHFIRDVTVGLFSGVLVGLLFFLW